MSLLQNFGFSNLTVLFICFSCCFSEEYSNDTLDDRNYHDDIVFRVIDGTPAKLGDAPYQVRLSLELYKWKALIKQPFSNTHNMSHASLVVMCTLNQYTKIMFALGVSKL